MQSLQAPPLHQVSPLLKQSPNLITSSSSRRVSFISASSTQPITTSPPKREKDPKKRVVITGMGVVSVFGNDVDTYYNKLLSGESGVSLIDRFDASDFSTRVAGQIRGFSSEGYIDEEDDKRLDDSIRYCLVAGKKAVEDADLGADKRSKVVNFLCSILGLKDKAETIKRFKD